MLLNKLLKLANKFEIKLNKYAQEFEQLGTTELFFQSDTKQKLFANKVMNDTSPVYEVLLNYFKKNEKPCSFSLDIVAEPKKGAKWELKVSPNNLKSKILEALNKIYIDMFSESMTSVQKKADAKAKKGAGCGKYHVADMDLM